MADTVLIVDDDTRLSAMLADYLSGNGYSVRAAATARAGVEEVARAAPGAVILDVMLPDFDGFEVYRRLRAADVTAPVMFLSARQSTDDKVHGLTLGGDDYVAKPFDIKELVARVEVLLRRGVPAVPPATRLQVGRLEADRASREVWKDGTPVQLSATEFDLLYHLMANPGKAVSKAEILSAVWGHDFHGDFGVVETYVYYLRRKLGQDLIRTVRNFGYLIAA